MEKTKVDYINEVEIGSLIAFKVNMNDAKLISGKIYKLGTDKHEVETKNGKRYFVNKENIIWVNTNGKWPRGILESLKGLN